MFWNSTQVALVLTLSLAVAPGCRKADRPPESSSPSVSAPPVDENTSRKPSGPRPAVAEKVTAEPSASEPDDDADFDDIPLDYRLSFTPTDTVDIALRWNDDGTDLEVAASRAGHEQAVGSIQSRHHDQVVRVVKVSTCERDDDPMPELCVRYQADPLGSTREDTYEAETVFDYEGGRFLRPARSK